MIFFLALMLFNEPYNTTDPGVTPPVVTYKIEPFYPVMGQQLKLKGYVILKCIVRANGQIDQINIERQLGKGLFGFEDEAIYSLKRWEFEPGKFEGQPVDVRFVLKFDFADIKGRMAKKEKAMWRLSRKQNMALEVIKSRSATGLMLREKRLDDLRVEFPVLEGKVNTRDATYYQKLEDFDTELNLILPRVNWVNLRSFEQIKPKMTMAKVRDILGHTFPILGYEMNEGWKYTWINVFGDGQIDLVFDKDSKVTSKSQNKLRPY